jgi:hypothetical protein
MSENLDVYEARTGWWHPVIGEVGLPDGWEFLASGDAFVTRRVKAGGVYWTAWKPKNRGGGHRRRLGLLAPGAAVESARADATATAAQRATARAASTRHRDRTEADYQAEMRDAIHQWLDFAAEHAALASDIADGATAKATVVGSGRVGRTRTLGVDERAALAARAYIRHHYTDYEARLDEASGMNGDDLDGGEYREIKQIAHDTVEAFLRTHRKHDTAGTTT